MHQDDFNRQITQKLNQLAYRHPAKQRLMEQVALKTKATKWKLMSYAIAAAITGFMVLPNLVQHQTNPTVAKLSPQMVEDLEMVRVFGEDTHGS